MQILPDPINIMPELAYPKAIYRENTFIYIYIYFFVL